MRQGPHQAAVNFTATTPVPGAVCVAKVESVIGWMVVVVDMLHLSTLEYSHRALSKRAEWLHLQVRLKARGTMDGMTIGEVSRRAGLRPSAIRYYESLGLVPKPRRASGQRRYDDSVLEWLSLIA